MTRPAPSRFLVWVVPPVWSPAELTVLESTLSSATRRLSDAGMAVRFLRTIPGDADRHGAVCVFEAESQATVRRVLEIAQVPASRIEAASGGTSLPPKHHRPRRQAFIPVVVSPRHGADGGGAPAP